MKQFLTLILALAFLHLRAQPVEYPYPVKSFAFTLEDLNVKMAYMDVEPKQPNGKSVILFHGKNFNGYYWKDVIPFLSSLGYRVIVPDQLGFGESDKPVIHYSFHQLAANSKALLDSLGIRKVSVIGHSMGGMLAARFCLMFPAAVDRLVLENPIGLEDYRTFVPYTSADSLYKQEFAATYESYKKYQQSYYPEWKPEYEELVRSQAKWLTRPGFREVAKVNALTYQMIYEQPVVYELKNIRAKTLIIIGTLDRTIVGKARVPKEQLGKYGQYQQLGKQIQKQMEGSTLVELGHVGHIPHVQDPEAFKKALGDFMKQDGSMPE